MMSGRVTVNDAIMMCLVVESLTKSWIIWTNAVMRRKLGFPKVDILQMYMEGQNIIPPNGHCSFSFASCLYAGSALLQS